jgi:ABC-type polar amino acid transport system ATPase subunit
MSITTTEPVLRVEGLRKAYGENEVLKGVDFNIHRGEVKAILGPSGSGKSTMLRLMALLETADGGEIFLEGSRIGVRENGSKDATPLSERAMAKQRVNVGMVFQKFNLFPHLNALHNVMVGLTTVKHVSRHEATEKAKAMLARVGLAERAHAFPSELSGGQQQRVAIARALVMDPTVLLFDEPTSALDPELVGEVLAVMESLAGDGMTMAVVTHEVKFAQRVASEVVMFDGGYIIEQAAPDEFFGSPQHERTRKFLSHVH